MFGLESWRGSFRGKSSKSPSHSQGSGNSPIPEEVSNGDSWPVSDEESEILSKFKERVINLLPEESQQDHELLRWLKARNFDLDKAELMLKNNIVWRREWGIDELLDWKPPEVLLKYYPVGQIGHDKAGRPVWIIPFGGCDMYGLLMSVSKKNYMKYTFQTLEMARADMKKQSELLGCPVTQQTTIFDMENFSLKNVTWKPALDVVLQIVQMYEANYPEFLHCAYVINAPAIFTAAYAMIRPFLHEVTMKKICIYGHNGWKEDILKVIDENELPQHWGGTKTDSDGNPKCPSLVCLGGEVPTELYQNQNNIDKISEENFEHIVVGRGGKKKIEIEVIQPGTVLKWQFNTKDHDICFGIKRKVTKGDDEMLQPVQRVNSHFVTEEGSLYCTQPGTYVLIFDNSYSYMRAKNVFHSIDIELPKNKK
ncbi:unnamed protein product [Meganyctiphanes norvegica]|uniref:SEC14-like protein 2 n=1 Tax=Meganyctiphanes norvegica TaxID=48144 RepID=A0AAV2RSM9_MEGNR